MMCPTCGKDGTTIYIENVMEYCPTCSFMFVTPHERLRQQRVFIDTEQLDEQTVQTLARKYPKESHAKRDLYARTAQQLLALCTPQPADVHAIDLGANGGFFLRELEQRGVQPSNMVAGEMSPNYIELTKRYFGYPTIRGNIEDMPTGQSFHLITMFDVLEHINDVPQTMRTLHTLLVPEGILFLKLPNGVWARTKSLIPRLLGASSFLNQQLYLEPGGHLNYWNPRNIHHLERYGFSLVETGFVEPTRTQFKLKYVLYHVWYLINTICGFNLYPEFYAIFRKK